MDAILSDTALGPDARISIKKHLYLSAGEDCSPDVAAFHHDSTTCTHCTLARNHDLAHRWMHRHTRRGGGHISFANALRYVATVEQNAVPFRLRLELNRRLFRKLAQGFGVVERTLVFKGLESEGPIHRSAFEVDVAQFLRKASGDGTFAGACGAIDRDHQGACGGHSDLCSSEDLGRLMRRRRSTSGLPRRTPGGCSSDRRAALESSGGRTTCESRVSAG